MGTTKNIRERINLSNGSVAFAIALMITILVIYLKKAPEQKTAPTSHIEMEK